jgi:diguanylate cyclase (GGDEF)-like protein
VTDIGQVSRSGTTSALRRIARSRLLVLMVVVFFVCAHIWLTDELEARGHVRADEEGKRTAEVVATLVVHPHVATYDPAGGFTAEALSDMRNDVVELRGGCRLLGLGVWALDGTPLFLDFAEPAWAGRPMRIDLERARAGQSWTAHARTSGPSAALEVILPLREVAGSAAATSGIVRVLLPHSALTKAAEERLWRQQVAYALVFLMFTAGLVWLRQRLLRRERQARQDSLTGLLNRRALLEDGDALLKRVNADRLLVLLLIDLGEFKKVNDTLGHSAGDLLLQQVAVTLLEAVRDEDLVVRLGGDEFAVVLPDVPTPADGLARAEQLLRRLREASYSVHGIDLVVDAGIGVAVAPQHGTSVPVLLQRADVAMYQAKRSNSGVQLYTAEADDHTVRQLAMVTELHRALDNDEFVLHYQPKVRLPGGEVTSVEALVRWQHPVRGLLGPGEFLPLVEGTGLMQPLTRWVLRKAVQQAASWRRAGMPLQVAVNISPSSLLEADFPARVLSTLLGAEVPASLLQLEITETAIMSPAACGRRAAGVARPRHRGGHRRLRGGLHQPGPPPHAPHRRAQDRPEPGRRHARLRGGRGSHARTHRLEPPAGTACGGRRCGDGCPPAAADRTRV